MATPSAIAAQAEQHTTQLRQLIDTVTAQATTALTTQLAAAQATTIAAWIAATGDLATTPDRNRLTRLITDTRSRLTTAMAGQAEHAQRSLRAGAQRATAMGAQQAARIATTATGTPALPPPPPPADPEVQQAIDQVPAQVREQHTAALALLTAATIAATGWAGIVAAFNTARRAAARIRTAAAWIIGASAAHGVRAFTTRTGPRTVLLWVAEPGACPACRAYAGRHIAPGGTFPGGLTHNRRRAYFPQPIPGPPRHPWCRCVLIPWNPAWGPLSTISAQLRRRARAPRP